MKDAMPFGRESVYIMHDGSAVKIGRAVDVRKRCKLLQTGNSRAIRVLFSAGVGTFSAQVEGEMHRKFKSRNLSGEWFDISVKEALSALVMHARCFVGAPISAHDASLFDDLKKAVREEDEKRGSVCNA